MRILSSKRVAQNLVLAVQEIGALDVPVTEGCRRRRVDRSRGTRRWCSPYKNKIKLGAVLLFHQQWCEIFHDLLNSRRYPDIPESLPVLGFLL